MDLSKLSDADLIALRDNKLNDMSDVGLRLIAGMPQPEPEKGILAGLKKGVLSPLSSIRTGIESLIPETNAPENAALKGLQRQEELAKKYESAANLEKVKQAYKEKGLLSAAGEAISQVPGAIAEQVPQMGAMFTGARLGAAAGSVAGPGGTLFGGVVGAAVPLLAQFYGTNIERQAQEQIKSGDPVKIDRGNAALAAAPQAALDMVEARLLFGSKLISSALKIKPTSLASMPTALVEKKAQEKLLPLLLRGTAEGAAAEIPTEIGQQMLERAQAGLSITSPDALAEYGDTAYQVGLLGPLGAVGRISERGAARTELAGREAADRAILADQQAQAAAPTMAPITQAPAPTTQQNLFPKEEVPTQLSPDVLEATTAKGKPLEIPAPQAPERQLSELQRNIDALTQKGTPESLAEAEQLKAQLPEATEARVARLGEEMMTLERKYKALEIQRDETKALKEKEPLSLQMNQIRERQNEILREGKALEKEGVSFEPAGGLFGVEGKKKPQVAEQMGLNLENVITEDDFKTMGIGKGNKKLREAILGKSLADPKERAFIINALDTYAQGNISEGLATRVGKFAEELKKEAPSEPLPRVGTRAGEPSVRVPSGQQQPAQGITAPAATGLAGAEPVVGGPAVGEGAAREVGQIALTPEEQAQIDAARQARNQRIAQEKATPIGSITGTQLQKVKELGKRLGVANFAGRLRGARNNVMAKAAEKGDTKGVLDALSKSKSPIYKHIADIAKTIPGLKIVIDPTKVETTFSKFKTQIEGAKITLAGLDALREAKRKVDSGIPVYQAVEGIVAYPKGLTKDVKHDISLSSILFSNKSLFDTDAFNDYVAKAEEDIKDNEANLRQAIQFGVEDVAVPGMYDPETNTVYMDDYHANREDIMAHELTHAITHNFLVSPGAKNTPTYKAIDKLFQHVKEAMGEEASDYGLTNVNEFVAEGLSNPEFQMKLMQIKYENTTAWNKFVQMVAKIIGLKPDNAFTELLNLTTTEAEKGQAYDRTGKNALSLIPTNTQAFEKWFGDSKVVNEDGSPMVVYHGSKNFEGNAFKPSEKTHRAENIDGFYFSQSAEDASEYATGREPQGITEGAEVIPVYLSIKNPFVYGSKVTPEMINAFRQELLKVVPKPDYVESKVRDMLERAKSSRNAPEIFPNISLPTDAKQRILKAGGYDGFQDGRHWVAFEPTQIKSAIGNRGTYSLESSNISFMITPQGTKAEQDMAAFGGRPEEKPKGFIERNRDSFQKTADEWRASAERNDSKVAATFGKFQNIASFDQAFNNRLYNHFMGLKNQGIITLEEAKQALLRISTSQALHRTNLANQIIDRGNFTYDVDSNRWYAVDDPVNMGKFEEIINGVADRLGVEPTRARQIVGAAYEANRLNSMYDSLRIVEKELATAERDVLKIKDAKQRATKKQLIKGLEEKVMELEGKARHKTPEQVAAGMRLYNSIPEIKEGTEIWNTMRGRVVKMLVDTGVKTEEQAEDWMNEAAYVPFFRDIEEEKAVGPNVMARGLRESMGDPYMRGSMKEVHDPIDNMYKWMQWSIARAVSNQQLNVMLDQYKAALPDEVKEGKGPDSNTFTVYRDGKLRFYNVADPAIAQAFVGLEPIIFPGISWLTGSSNFLRHAVTRNPLFSAGQLFMDSYTAMFTSGLKNPFGVLREIAKEVAATAQGTSVTRTELMKAGILETHDYAALTEADAIGKRLGLEKPGAWAKLAQRLDHLAAASDNVIRQGVYNQAIKEGLSHNEAMEKAAELVNFRRVSGDPRIQFLSRIVPFFNAYLQVSSVAVKTLTGRGISPQERDAAAKVLMATTAKIAMISMLYSMAVGDDDDYKKKNRITRDRMWMVPGSGGLGIPVRADIFSLPKVIGEYSYQMMANNGTTDSKMFKEAMSRAVMGSLSVPSEGIPQFVRPTLGVMTNYDFFQKREIVNATMRKYDVSQQYTKNTSEMARAFSSILQKMGIEASPLNIDYLVKGYLGTAGTLTAMATNDIIASASGRTRPSMSMQDMLASVPNASAFVSREENTAVLSDYYEAARDINKVVATASHLKTNPQAMREYIQEHKKEYQLKGVTQAINNQLVIFKRQEMQIRESNKSSEQKERELKQLDERRSRLTSQILKMRQKLYE